MNLGLTTDGAGWSFGWIRVVMGLLVAGNSELRVRKGGGVVDRRGSIVGPRDRWWTV